MMCMCMGAFPLPSPPPCIFTYLIGGFFLPVARIYSAWAVGADEGAAEVSVRPVRMCGCVGE